MFVLRVVGFEESEGVDEGVVTVLVTKEKELPYRIQDICVVLPQLSQGVACVHTLTNSDHELSRMGHHFSAMLRALKMIALSFELDVSCALL